MKVLVLNCGSSSVKFQLFEMDREELIVSGHVSRIGSADATLVYKVSKSLEYQSVLEVRDHERAIDSILKLLIDRESGIVLDVREIDAVGHRVVHGGEEFTRSVLINEEVFKKIKTCIRFAPLHNPSNIKGIQASLWLLPFARQVAVFDTSYHQTMKPDAYLYALPYRWYTEKKVRRYGFHGTSHCYVADQAAEILGKSIEKLKLVTCHLGNGASITANNGGKSIDTSMGFTPMEGLVMGTRCGDIDPAIPLYIMEEEKLTPEQMNRILNKESGLTGITDGDNDLRVIECKAESGNLFHQLAIDMTARRVKKYIGAYAAIMGGLDGVVFTAGIGENSFRMREKICADLAFFGIEINPVWNRENRTVISQGQTVVLVIPTNEELAIAQEVLKVLTHIKTAY